MVTDPSVASTLYLGCNNLSRSTNRGANWTQIAAPDLLTGPQPADDTANNNPLYAGQFATISTIGVGKSEPNRIYVGTDNGRLWETTNLGASWFEFPNPFDPDPPRWVTSVIVDPTDARHAYASYGGFRQGYSSANVYETTLSGDGSGGSTIWHNVSGNLPNAPVNFLAYDRPNDTLYAATDLGVFFMQSDTNVWTKLGDNLPNTATEDVKIQASSAKLYVATFGRGTWRIPLVAGTPRYNPQVVTDLQALSSTVTGMGLSAGVTSILTNSIESIRKEVKAGDNPCGDLDALKAQIDSYTPRKISTAQHDQLIAAIDHIKSENPC